jgi:hypothetical protein
MRLPSASMIVPTPSIVGTTEATPGAAATRSTRSSSTRSRTRGSLPMTDELRTMTSVPALASVKAAEKPDRMVSPSTSVAARKATPSTTAVVVPTRRRLRAQRPARTVENMVNFRIQR